MRGCPEYASGGPEIEQPTEQKPVETSSHAIRPTYGAYTSNTLPRGPYLQYKYSYTDRRHPQHHYHQQQLNRLSSTTSPSVASAGGASSPAEQLLLKQQKKYNDGVHAHSLMASKYATIANAKSMTNQPQRIGVGGPLEQQFLPPNKHSEPQLIRDNNQLRVSRNTVASGAGGRANAMDSNRTQTLHRYQYGSRSNNNKHVDNNNTSSGPSSTTAMMMNLLQTSSRSQTNVNGIEINLSNRSGPNPPTNDFSYVSMQKSKSYSLLLTSGGHQNPVDYLPPMKAASRLVAHQSARSGPPPPPPVLTYQSLPRNMAGGTLSSQATVSKSGGPPPSRISLNYAATANHPHHRAHNQQHPPHHRGVNGRHGNQIDSSASMFNVNYAADTDGRNEYPGPSSTPLVVAQQRPFAATVQPLSQHLGGGGGGGGAWAARATTGSTSASLSSLTLATEKRNQYLSGLLSSNNNLLMEWHRELAANGLSGGGSRGGGSNNNTPTAAAAAARHSSSSVSSSIGSMHTAGSQFTATTSESHEQQNHGRRPSTASSYNSTSDVSFVTLGEVLRVYPQGLCESEGWALLCQSVQALQDLFLADTPSTNRILPLVTANSLQITSRGRVAFNIVPVSQLGKYKLQQQHQHQQTSSMNGGGQPNHVIMDFLSPEFVQSIGQRATFSESDIEKMWIYALGVTLRQTLQSDAPAARTAGTFDNIIMDNQQQPAGRSSDRSRGSKEQLNGGDYHQSDRQKTESSSINCRARYSAGLDGWDSRGNDNHRKTNTSVAGGSYTSTLEFVINSMCNRSLELRASLMYLLDVISDYCKTHHQVKPFSHIVMDLFREAANQPERDGDPHHDDIGDADEEQQLNAKVQRLKAANEAEVAEERKLGLHNKNKKQPGDEKSDTDSGRSSDHGSDQPPHQQQRVPVRGGSKKLQVHRMPTIKSAENSPAKKLKPDAMRAPVENVLQVVRRKRRRETFRRNTIDVNRIDLDQAQQRMKLPSSTSMDALNVSKSTNCIDKLLMDERNEFHRKIEEMTFQGGTSLPDLTTGRIMGKNPTEPKLRVKRPTDPVCGLKIRKCVSTDDFRMQVNCGRRRPEFTGPDFIMKSFVPPKQIDLSALGTDRHSAKRFINILLLNGRTIQVLCNAGTINPRQILEAIFRVEGYEENYFLGLCVIIGGDFVFLPMDLKVHKVAPQGWTVPAAQAAKKAHGRNAAAAALVVAEANVSLSLFIRVKFYLPTLRGLNSLESRHLLYLQLRKSVLEKQILCTEDDLILLGGLALQAEVGDFQENMKYVEYFTISHYLPEAVYQRNRELAKYLRNSHYVKRGLHPVEAEHNFIRYVQELKEFGLHLYSAAWSKEDGQLVDIFLAISISGICLFERSASAETENGRQGQAAGTAPLDNGCYPHDSRLTFRRKLFVKFEWLEIENLCYSKHILCIVVRNRESLTGKDNNRVKYKLRMDKRKSYFAFCLASDHHRFYMKLRNSFVSLKEISNEFNIEIAAPGTNAKDNESGSSSSNQGHQSEDSSGGQSSSLTGGGGGGESQGSAGTAAGKLEKATARMRNIKKSMLNDNKLGKLRQKFIKRSKSVMELSNNANEFSQELKSEQANDNFKENLNPDQFAAMSPPPPAQLNNSNTNSMNRNKVRMGTRVFSQQFLNRSYDNICDNAFNMARMQEVDQGDGANQSMCSSVGTGLDAGDVCHEMGSMSFDPIDEMDSEEEQQAVVVCNPGGPKLAIKEQSAVAAYVLHESINSSSNYTQRMEQYSVGPAEETVSDSLLEKFNNLSSTGVEDRVIRTLEIKKDAVAPKGDADVDKAGVVQKTSAFERFKVLSSSRFSKRFLRSKKSKALEERDLEQQNYSLGISIVQGSDGNIYVKELAPGCAGYRHGIRMGDQILAVDNKSLAKVRYEEALRLLQSKGPVVQLTISQIVTPMPKTSKGLQRKAELYKSEENFRSLELYSILSHAEQDEPSPDDVDEVFDDPVLRYFANMKQEQEERALERRQFEVNGNNGSLPRVLSSSNNRSLLSSSKSVPDLPKVVAIIPKRVDRPALPKCIGLSRKYTGPVRYPVTPGKDPMLSRSSTSLEGVQHGGGKRQLSLPVNEHRESQVI